MRDVLRHTLDKIVLTITYAKTISMKMSLKREDFAKEGRFVCSICHAFFYHATSLAQHYEGQHEKKIGENDHDKIAIHVLHRLYMLLSL